MINDDYLTLKETADYFRVQPLTVRRWALGGKIPCDKVGGQWRFSLKKISDWAERGGGPRKVGDILIADDDDQIRSIWRRVLEAEGYAVREAENGEEALSRFKECPPDIMILDLDMPVMNGPRTLNIVRQWRPDLPVIIVTGFGDSELMESALGNSPFTVLSKPCSTADLVKTVKALFLKQ